MWYHICYHMRRVVLDTNVLVSALRSRRGASNRLLGLLGSGRVELVISVPLMLEYEYALSSMLKDLVYSESEVNEIIDFICAASEHQLIYYLWRPFLKDPRDDHVLEVAVAGSCEAILTYNTRDFRRVEQFGLQVLTPREFLKQIGEIR